MSERPAAGVAPETNLQPYRHLLEAALRYAGNNYTVEDLEQAVAAGRLQSWIGKSSICITEIVDNPRFRACNVFLAAGTLPEIEAGLHVVEEWARALGCARITFTGRKGWARTFLHTEGYESKLEVFEKVL